MNKIHRVVRDSVTGKWVVTSELSRARGKSKSLVRSVAFTVLMAAPVLYGQGASAQQVELSGSNGWMTYSSPCDTITVPSTCANEQRRGVAGIDEFKAAFAVQDSKEHGGITTNLRVFA